MSIFSYNFSPSFFHKLKIVLSTILSKHFITFDKNKSMSQKKYSGKFVVRIDPATHKLIAERAFIEGISINTIAKAALEAESKKTVKNNKKHLAV